jgi:predicted nucleic acid-binding protein
MKPELRLFLDTSALFSGIWSEKGGARMVLKLGEARVVVLLVSSQVLDEIENVILRKAPHLMATFVLLLDRSHITVVPSAPTELLERCHGLVSHRGDACILADAWANQVDYLVTLDKNHFLNAEGLSDQTPFIIGTPGDCLSWIKKFFQ